MTCQPFNIKVVEDNSFALLMPLKKRTYVSNVPVDEDINALELTDVTLKIGDTEYTPELGTDGVRVVMPDGLTRGTYNVILRAKYRGSDITAAYFEAITAVQWNYQSDAEQYVQGSPIVFEAAYVIGGALTDAELVALKAALRAAIAAVDIKIWLLQLMKKLSVILKEKELIKILELIRLKLKKKLKELIVMLVLIKKENILIRD